MQQSPSHMTQQPFMATVTQLQNSHSKGPAGGCEGKGPENEFGWKISFLPSSRSPLPKLAPLARAFLPRVPAGAGLRAGCTAVRGGRILPHPLLPLGRISRTTALLPCGRDAAPTSILYKLLFFSFRVLIAKTHALGKEVAGPIALPAKQTLPRAALKGSGFTLRAHPSSRPRPRSSTVLGCGGVADLRRLVRPQPFNPHWFPWASR